MPVIDKNKLTQPFDKTKKQNILALYHYEGCPFCATVQKTIRKLAIAVELRDTHQDSCFQKELIETRGCGTVPVLRITSPEGKELWLAESYDIAEYLEQSYG